MSFDIENSPLSYSLLFTTFESNTTPDLLYETEVVLLSGLGRTLKNSLKNI